jgi:hypothetical protein
MADYGACKKIGMDGLLDGCGEFEAKEDNAKYCEACDCHRSFHKRQPAEVASVSVPNFVVRVSNLAAESSQSPTAKVTTPV